MFPVTMLQSPNFVYYRLLDGLQEFVRLKLIRFGEILFEPLKNG